MIWYGNIGLNFAIMGFYIYKEILFSHEGAGNDADGLAHFLFLPALIVLSLIVLKWSKKAVFEQFAINPIGVIVNKIIIATIALYVLVPSAYTYAKDVYIEMKKPSIEELPTHNPAVFAQGRYCTNYLKFECLPESKNLSWQKNIDEKAEYGLTDEEAKHEKELTYKYDKLEKKMGNYTVTKADDAFFKRIEFKSFLTEMEEGMEKQYPGFWGDTPKPVRYRWMRLCVAKANKYGYGLDEKDTDGTIIPANIRETWQFIELCGRIGLYFDSDPKWQYIVDYIKLPESVSRGYAGAAVDYIDFTIFNKDHVPNNPNMKFTDWSLKDSLGRLPYPNRHVPSINDPE